MAADSQSWPSPIVIPKRKHVTLELSQKLEILEKLKAGRSQNAIASEYNVGRATVYDIKMKENELRHFYGSQMESELGKRKVMRKGDNDRLDAAIYRWFLQQHGKGLPVNGPTIKAKAAVFNKKLRGSDRFASSEGWLSKWKKRLGVRHLTVTGKCHMASEKYSEEFDKMVREEDLTSAAVYNADETELSLEMLPSLNFPENKQQNGRITLMACCNADGSHKLPLLLIGKSQRPSCFHHVRMTTLPVDYRAQRNAWMNSEIFSQWFHETFVPAVRVQLIRKKLPPKAILLIDNAPGHPRDSSLVSGDIRAVLLPPKVNHLIQPMDRGILETIKRNYRQSLLTSLLSVCENQCIDDVIKAWNAVNMRDVVFHAAEAWDGVDRSTIVESWRNMWPSMDAEMETSMEYIEEPGSSLSADAAFADALRQLAGLEVDEEEIVRWLNEGNDEEDEGLTDDEIIKSVQQEETRDESDEEEDDGVKISHADGAETADIFLQYIMQQEDTCSADVMMVKRLRDRAYHRRASSLRSSEIPETFQTYHI